MSTVEDETLLVATGTSKIELMHRTYDRMNRTAGLTTGTAWHAKKQDPELWRRRHWSQILGRLAGKVYNW